MSKKWNLQDIQPIDRSNKSRNTQTIRSSSSRPTVTPEHEHKRPPVTEMKSRSPHHEEDRREDDFDTLPTVAVENKPNKGKHYMLVALAIFIVSIVGAFSIGTLTGGAEITIFPKVRSMNVNAEFTAYKDKRAGELSYEILTLEATGERQVTATGQEEVSIQTVGEIDIFKTTAGSERLIKNTRFSTADGKVFRIQESVVIPGATQGADGTLVPGVVRAEVFADEAGESYNIGARTRLSVPGFQESNLTELYNAIYAENPSSFTGGFNGPRFIIDEDELNIARESLQRELRETLIDKIATERPADYTVFQDSVTITYASLPPTQQGDSLVTIKEQATLRIPLFNNEDFASFIAKETIIGYETSEKVRIDNVGDISFSYSDPATREINIAEQESIAFNIIGQPVIVWTYEEEALKEALVGKEKTALPLALSQYSQESRSSLKIRPFWKNSFPDSVDKISITEVLTQE
ncbi:MAG: hypothetical protein ACK42D_03790 [Candidatus Paceibacteria bacterium]